MSGLRLTLAEEQCAGLVDGSFLRVRRNHHEHLGFSVEEAPAAGMNHDSACGFAGWDPHGTSAVQRRAADTQDVVRALHTMTGLATKGTIYKRLKVSFGITAGIKRMECSYGGWNGAHPNAHIVLLLPAVFDELERADEFGRASRRRCWAGR